MANCMMESKSFPPIFWDEEFTYAAYIQNSVPHKSLDGITPFEAWNGHKPDVSHFRIFGSKAWARNPLEKRKNLESKIKE